MKYDILCHLIDHEREQYMRLKEFRKLKKGKSLFDSSTHETQSQTNKN